MFEDFNEVVCLGMGGSYSEIAKDKLFKAHDLYLYQRSLNSIKECIDYVDENCNAIAVLPVETTYKGIMISKANAQKEMFKIDLLCRLEGRE